MDNRPFEERPWWKKLTFTEVLASYMVTLCMGYLIWISYLVTRGKVTNDIAEIKMSIIAILTMVVGFFFGAAHQSKKTEEAIRNSSAKSQIPNVQSENVQDMTVQSNEEVNPKEDNKPN